MLGKEDTIMRIIVRNHMFYVLENSKEVACFKSFAMLADYISVVARIKGIMVLNSIEGV